MAVAKISSNGKVYGWEYQLKRNYLASYNPSIKGDYTAFVPSESITISSTIAAAQIVAERSEFRLQTIIQILELCAKTERQFICKGYRVNNGLCNIRGRLRGRFDDSSGTLEKVKKSAIANINKEVKQILKEVPVFKTTYVAPVMTIASVFDYTAQGDIDKINRGGIVAVTGANLVMEDKSDTEKATIKFSSSTTSATVTYNLSDIIVFDNTSKLFTFTLPSSFFNTFSTLSVSMEITTYRGLSGKPRKTPVTFTYNKLISVN